MKTQMLKAIFLGPPDSYADAIDEFLAVADQIDAARENLDLIYELGLDDEVRDRLAERIGLLPAVIDA